MVDFKELLGKRAATRTSDPIEIFARLDKRVGKENLRDSQRTVLRDWYDKFRKNKDIFVKLHTGQGKTLIGLLMLQSSINDNLGPSIYLCPNKFLVSQTIKDAGSFGIAVTNIDDEDRKLPLSFINSERILVTTCNKLLNGRSVFGVAGSGRAITPLGALVLDDAHKCIDIIRETFSVRINRYNSEQDQDNELDYHDPASSQNKLYADMWNLFEETIRRQGAGTHADIVEGRSTVVMVPYWIWNQRQKDVVRILQEHKDEKGLIFSWDLIKNKLEHSYCLFSGRKLEIVPRLLPVDLIPSFSQCGRRIFLSATLTEDAFLVKDLGVDPKSVLSPLASGDVKYSGERLILIPTLVDTFLSRDRLISWIAGLAKSHGNFGVVAITPASWQTNSWEANGAQIAHVNQINRCLEDLTEKIKTAQAKQALVLVNEYDGVDMPDDLCRILVLDSLPSYRTLIDTYLQNIRPLSSIIRRQIAQRVEQGMGRAIRGSSDWCIVVIIGNDLVNFLSETSKRKYLSTEAQMQITIGETLAKTLKREGARFSAMETLVNQSLARDPYWKQYYSETMAGMEQTNPDKGILNVSQGERKAEILFQQGQVLKAVEVLDELAAISDDPDKGWYTQLIATYLFPHDVAQSTDRQLKAFEKNNMLLRPEVSFGYSKILGGSKNQAANILAFIKKHSDHSSLTVEIWNILDKVKFGAPFATFQAGLSELGEAIGLETQEPERVSGEGPDNLWRIKEKTFWIVECKNMVKLDRLEISKAECSQMNNDIGWFRKMYENNIGLFVMIHPATKFAKGAFPNEPLWIMDLKSLDEMKSNVIKFYSSLTETSFSDLSSDIVRKKLDENSLSTEVLQNKYLKRAVAVI